MKDFFQIYDLLIRDIPDGIPVTGALSGQCWTAVEAADRFGMAMTTPVDTAPRMLTRDHRDLSLREVAEAAKSWNLSEAGFGMAAINAYYNTPERLEALNAYEPFENYCTDGLDLTGKTIGIIGHLNMPESIRRQAKEIYILERNPQPGDYPDSACDFLLPRCDVVIMTASTLVNKTLPHLLDLCRDAYTVLAGPTCPLCPALLDAGLDRIAGLVITDVPGMKRKIVHEIPGPPYPHGKPFLLAKERL